MEATWDDQMLWRCAEDVDEFVIPGWIKALDNDFDDDVYFSNVMIPEPKPQPDDDVVFKPDDDDVVVQPDDDVVLVQYAHPLRLSYTLMMFFSNKILATLKLNVPSIIITLSVLWMLLPRI